MDTGKPTTATYEEALLDLVDHAVATGTLPALRAARPVLDRALGAATARDIDNRLTTTTTPVEHQAVLAELAAEYEVSISRVRQLRVQNAHQRGYQQRKRTGEPVPARERAAQWRDARRARLATEGARWLARRRAGTSLVDLAAEAMVSRQKMTAMLRAAEAAAQQPTQQGTPPVS